MKLKNSSLNRGTTYSARKRILIKMKLTAALLLLCFLHVSAAGLAQTVSIERKEAKLSEILTEIHKQTGYNILFNDKIIAAVPSISMSAKNMKLTDLLDKLLIPNKLK